MPLSPTDVFIVVFGAGILLFIIGFAIVTAYCYIRGWLPCKWGGTHDWEGIDMLKHRCQKCGIIRSRGWRTIGVDE